MDANSLTLSLLVALAPSHLSRASEAKVHHQLGVRLCLCLRRCLDGEPKVRAIHSLQAIRRLHLALEQQVALLRCHRKSRLRMNSGAPEFSGGRDILRFLPPFENMHKHLTFPRSLAAVSSMVLGASKKGASRS